MAKSPVFEVKRDGDTVIVKSKNSGGWSFGIYATLSALFFVFWSKGSETDIWQHLLGSGAPIILFPGALLIIVMRTITTAFDLRSRRASHTVSWCSGLIARRRDYAFDEIEGMGVHETSSDGGHWYVPVLILRNGKKRWMAAGFGDYSAFASVVNEACDMTGLTRVPMTKH